MKKPKVNIAGIINTEDINFNDLLFDGKPSTVKEFKIKKLFKEYFKQLNEKITDGNEVILPGENKLYIGKVLNKNKKLQTKAVNRRYWYQVKLEMACNKNDMMRFKPSVSFEEQMLVGIKSKLVDYKFVG